MMEDELGELERMDSVMGTEKNVSKVEYRLGYLHHLYISYSIIGLFQEVMVDLSDHIFTFGEEENG
jgi:hypothetical protein